MGPCLSLLLHYPSNISERCNLVYYDAEPQEAGACGHELNRRRTDPTPETVVAALALALTSLALLGALAQNS